MNSGGANVKFLDINVVALVSAWSVLKERV